MEFLVFWIRSFRQECCSCFDRAGVSGGRVSMGASVLMEHGVVVGAVGSSGSGVSGKE